MIFGIELNISIHGLGIKGEDEAAAADFLAGWLREATKAAILGNQRDLFNHRHGDSQEIDEDIEVKVSGGILPKGEEK